MRNYLIDLPEGQAPILLSVVVTPPVAVLVACGILLVSYPPRRRDRPHVIRTVVYKIESGQYVREFRTSKAKHGSTKAVADLASDRLNGGERHGNH